MNTPLQDADLAGGAPHADILAMRSRIDALVSNSELLREANENLLIASVDAQNLRDAAEMAIVRQNEFLAMLAHELRNPLAPISLANAMLARLPAPSVELLNLHGIIERQVHHLTRLLDDLLDAARISSGKVTLLRDELPLVELLRRAVQTVQVRMRDRSQHLVLDLHEELAVNGDPVRLAQVFSNLLVNASKYTGEGGTIRLAAHAHAGWAVITVSDNGNGIAPEVIPHIFELFTQGPRALARSEGGLGVGLSVVRNVVQLHGGDVSVASEGAGRGSEFSVRLPLSAGLPAARMPAPDALAPLARRILVVEDNPDANDTLSSVLTAAGHHVTSVYDGIAGLALASKHVFDVMLCDIGLPGLDGLQLLAQLRATTNSQIPFAVAISGYGQVEDRERAARAGYGQYFVKPVDVGVLLALISSETVTRFVAAANRRH